MDLDAVGRPRPRWRGHSHLWAFIACVPAGIYLIVSASPGAPRVTAIIYVAALLALFGTSSVYHSFRWSPRNRDLLRRLDHCAIYLLIAGTYTPVCIVAFPPRWGIPMLSIVGGGAALGVAIKLFAFGRLYVATYILYPALGWVAVFSMPALLQYLTVQQFILIVAGGLAYSVGVVVLWRKWPDPWPRVFGYHEVWHGLVVVAAGLHFAAIASLVR